MVDHRRRRRRETGLAIALVIVGALLVNALAARHSARIDLTADGRHTLAPITRQVIDEIDGVVEVRAYLPQRIQPPYNRSVRALEDTLQALQAQGGDRLRLTLIDPTDPDLDADARRRLDEQAEGDGVVSVETQVTEGDALVQRAVRFGVAFIYRDRQVAAAPIERPADAEYVLTRALRAAVRGETRRPVIGFSVGHDEPDMARSPVARLLDPLGDVQRIELDGQSIPPTVDALVIVGPRRPFGERDQYVIDQFLMRGRAVIALLDYRPPSPTFPDVLVPLETGLEGLFAHHGVTIDPSRTIIDRTRALPAPVGRDHNGRVITVNHPLFVRVEALAAEHPATRGLDSLAAPLAAPISIDPGRGMDAVVLASTGPAAGTRTGVSTLEPATYREPPSDVAIERPGPVPVAAAARGAPPSYFVDRPRPDAPAEQPGAARATPEPPFTARARGEARLLVMTSGTRMLAAGENGLLFLQNAVAWAVADGALSALRARAAQDPPLRETTAATRSWMRTGLVIGPSLLLLLFAGVRRWRRGRA